MKKQESPGFSRGEQVKTNHTNKGDQMNNENEYVTVEGWCVECGASLDGQPIDGPELCRSCESEAVSS